MYIIPIAWLYVAVMMSVGAPGRKRAIRAREAAELATSRQPDAGSLAATNAAVPPVNKEP